MKIEGNYIKFDKDEYLESIDYIDKIVDCHYDCVFGGKNYSLNHSFYEDVFGDEYFPHELDVAYYLHSIRCKMLLAKRFDIDAVVIETDNSIVSNIAIDFATRWKE